MLPPITERGTRTPSLGIQSPDSSPKDFVPSPKLILPHGYNPGALYLSHGVLAVARELRPEVFERMDGQDDNVLKVLLLGREGSEELHELVIPSPGIPVANWEDTRVLQTDQNEGIVGATAKRRNGRDVVNPSLFIVRWQNDQLVVVGKPLVLTEIEGKNTTPVSHDNDRVRFLYRDEGFDHSLFLMTVETASPNGHRLIRDKRIDFPAVGWAEYKVGTVAEPIPTPNGNLLLPMHGQKLENGKYIYSIGVAELTRDFDLLGISRNPIFVRSDFPTKNELHPNEKEVVYSCAQLVEGTQVRWLVSVGDDHTFLTSPKAIQELQQMQMIKPEQLPPLKMEPIRLFP